MPSLPPVTLGLILACVAVFSLDQLLPLDHFFALWPLASGAFMPWQLVTYGFLHGGLAHLIFNMLGLWMFGSELERLWGRNRYLVFLLASLHGATAGTDATNGLYRWFSIGSIAAVVFLTVVRVLAGGRKLSRAGQERSRSGPRQPVRGAEPPLSRTSVS